jgi:hypothetical protein
MIRVNCTSWTESRIDSERSLKDAELDGRWQQSVELGQHLVHSVGDGDGVGIRLALHRDNDRANSVELRARLVVLHRVFDLGNVLQAHGRSVAPGHRSPA